MLEMVKEAEKQLLNYPQRNLAYYLKRTVKTATGKKQEPLDKIKPLVLFP